MKTRVKRNSVLKTIAVATVAVLLISAIPVTKLVKTIKKEHVKTANNISASQIDVQYIGSGDNTYDFNVKFENTQAQKLILLIRNDEGEVCYKKEFNEVHFFKTIRIEKDENNAYSIHPTFEVKGENGSVKRSFTIEKQLTPKVVVTNS